MEEVEKENVIGQAICYVTPSALALALTDASRQCPSGIGDLRLALNREHLTAGHPFSTGIHSAKSSQSPSIYRVQASDMESWGDPLTAGCFQGYRLEAGGTTPLPEFLLLNRGPLHTFSLLWPESNRPDQSETNVLCPTAAGVYANQKKNQECLCFSAIWGIE